MTTVGRNDPCPCGSGKKYKKCHGATPILTPEFGYDRVRALDGELGVVLARFAKKHFGSDSQGRAWEQFVLEDDIPFGSMDSEADFFDRFYTLDWRPEGDERLPELLQSHNHESINADLRRLIEATVNSPYSFLQVIEVKKGNGLVLRDILREREWNVTERAATATLERGHIIFARVVEMDAITFLMGCGGTVFPARFLGSVLDVRKDIKHGAVADDDRALTRTLLDDEDLLRDYYFLMTEELLAFKPEIRNTDGDPLSLHTLTYSIPPLKDTFNALKDLETSVTGATDEAMYKHADKDKKGSITKISVAWLKKTKNNTGGNTALGTLTIGKSKLVVEVNSEKRSKLIQKEITKRLGDVAVLLKTEILSHEGILEKTGGTKGKRLRDTRSDADRQLLDSPEAKNLIKEMMEKHWATWPDIPLPALRGMTPRKAAKDHEGRELLESLLMEFESRNEKSTDDFQRPDISKLRRELGLDPG